MAKKRRRKVKQLVSQHLEDISAKMLRQYQDEIREYIKGQNGVYALYSTRGDLYYVGLASNLNRRLTQHLSDRHRKLWDRFSVYLINDDRHMKELESLVLRIVKPKGNRQSGKLKKSENLKRELEKVLQERHKREIEELVGRNSRTTASRSSAGGRKRRTRKTRTSRAGENEVAALAPYVKRGMTIKAAYKGYEYTAKVRSNGWILYNGYLYATPSAVAQKICKRNVNGWSFWKYKVAPKEWVRLKELRG